MASPDSKIRDRAVRTVQTFLGNKGDSLSYDEYLKLWKGFFYCFWLSDKTNDQNNLAELIAKLVHNLPVEKDGTFAESGASRFLRSFWETMGREWTGLDRLRLNKYYNLMKQVLHQTFQMIAILSETEEGSVTWSCDLIKGHNSILLGTVFDYSNRAYPESLRNFVVENYFELLKSSSEESFSAEMTVLVCEPIVHAVAYCQSKAFFKQSSEALIQGLIPGEDDDEDVDSENSENDEDADSENSVNYEADDFENSENTENEDLSYDSQEEDSSSENSESGTEITSVMEESNVENSEFDSEEFDNIKEGCCEHDHEHSHEHEHEHDCEKGIFDYSLLGKFIFDFGAREDVLIRNRRFLFELSQIIEEVASGLQATSCCNHEDSVDANVELCCN